MTRLNFLTWHFILIVFVMTSSFSLSEAAENSKPVVLNKSTVGVKSKRPQGDQKNNQDEEFLNIETEEVQFSDEEPKASKTSLTSTSVSNVSKKEDSSKKSSQATEKVPEASISESLASRSRGSVKGEGIFSFISDDYSWVWDSKTTKQELAIVPIYFMSKAYGANWGLRVFSFPPKSDDGYHLSLAVKNQIGSAFLDGDVIYIKKQSNGLEIEAFAKYTNYLEPYFFGEGMETTASHQVFIYYNRLILNYQYVQRLPSQFFYGMKGNFVFRREISSPKGEIHHHLPLELTSSGKVLIGHDSRDSWENTTTGQYHTVAAGCVMSLGYKSSFCSIDVDLRSYFYVYEKIRLALRGFAGTTLLAPATYTSAYRLGGVNVLRGFSDNRFVGDRIYFIQAELRRNIWKKIVSGVFFFEIGEVASFTTEFKQPKWDYGLGLRFSIPPSYNLKIRADLGISTEATTKQRFNFIINFHHAF